jgi:6-phosphogluconolactonase
MRMKVRGLLSLVVASAAMLMSSCGHYTCGATFGSSSCSSSGGGLSGGGGANGSGAAFAYLLAESSTAGPSMAADELDLVANTWTDEGATFVIPPLPLSPVVDGGTAVVSLTSKKYLYIPWDDSTLSGFAIDGTTGALTPVPNSPYIATGGTSIASDPAGRFLFVSDFATGDITAFTINSNDGSLTPVSGSPFLSGISAAQIATDGQGKFLYVAEGLGGVHVAAFAINQTSGALATVTGSPFAFSMQQVAGEKSGKFMLGITGVDNHIHVFGINSTSGAIAEVAGSPFATVSAPFSIAVHPTGTFVYTFHSAGAAIEGYQISSAGSLTAVAGSPFAAAMLAEGQFDQSGDFLFGVGVGALGFPNFVPYPVDATTGIVTAATLPTLGFPGGGFAVTDLDVAP